MHPDAIRLHIPRTLRLVYDIRNKRDVAHLGPDIDPNLQDSTLVVSALDWVLAEFIRLYHAGMTPDNAQKDRSGHCDPLLSRGSRVRRLPEGFESKALVP